MNHYKSSDGTRISKKQIDLNVRDAKRRKLEYQKNFFGYNFCEECHTLTIEEHEKMKNSMELRILDCSHNISVDKCQKEGRSELAWDLKNITIRCRYHHRKHDKS